MSYEHLQEVSNDYEKLLKTGEGYDVIIYAGQNENVETIFAHSIILCTRSQYFRADLFKENVEKRYGKFILKKSDIPPNYLKITLRYIYCGKIDMTNLQGPDILKLLIIIEDFNIQSLILCIKEHLAKHQDEFLQQNEKLFENGEEYDVIIHAGRNEDFKAIHTHSFILRIRSQYFCTKLSKENIEKVDGNLILKENDISPRQLTIILRYIYCEKIDLTNLQGHDVLKLLIAVTELNIQPLIPRIQEHLIKHQFEFLQQNPMEILEKIYQHEPLAELWNICLKNICDEPEKSFDSDKFINLKAPIMELILKRDDLALDEIYIWDRLIKWGMAQNSDILQDAAKWTNEQITIMERTFHRCIPLIRFYDISSEDFFYNVLPYKELLPKQLIYQISEFHMVPKKKLNVDKQSTRKPKVNSVIIDYQPFALFASWIDKNNDLCYNSINNPYKFNLLYRASRDGLNASVFHNKCDNKGATIVIANIKGTDQIFGGYNPLVWDSSNSYKATYDSFIYSFTNKKDINTAIIGRVNNNKYTNAIHCYSSNSHGVAFGGGHDFYYNNNNKHWCFHPHSYPSINLSGNFLADDYEVFQVIRK